MYRAVHDHSRQPLFDQLETRLCLSAVAFSAHKIECCAVDGALMVAVADVDNDGDLDVLSASSSDNRIAWYENIHGKRRFGPQRVITRQADGASSVVAGDVDGDGDLDVLSGSFRDSKIAWFENLDGNGLFGPEQVITSQADEPRSVIAADLDGDGDLDVASASSRDGRIAWYEQRLVGDANDDGVFNSSDLVLVFQAGEYEDKIPGNSTFEEGDWNGDSEFDSADLVMAFQNGHYERGGHPRAVAAGVVEWLFAKDRDKRLRPAFEP